MAPPDKPNGSSSDDLQRARELSRALTGETKPTAAAASPYVTFAPRPVVPASAPVVRPRPLSAPSTDFGPGEWDALLDACLAATRAELAMITDMHGLVVASRGEPVMPVEAIASHLLRAFEQADRTSASPTLSLSAETEKGTVHGVRLNQANDFLLLALVVPGGLTSERQAALWSVLSRLTQSRARPASP